MPPSELRDISDVLSFQSRRIKDKGQNDQGDQVLKAQNEQEDKLLQGQKQGHVQQDKQSQSNGQRQVEVQSDKMTQNEGLKKKPREMKSMDEEKVVLFNEETPMIVTKKKIKKLKKTIPNDDEDETKRNWYPNFPDFFLTKPEPKLAKPEKRHSKSLLQSDNKKDTGKCT